MVTGDSWSVLVGRRRRKREWWAREKLSNDGQGLRYDRWARAYGGLGEWELEGAGGSWGSWGSWGASSCRGQVVL